MIPDMCNIAGSIEPPLSDLLCDGGQIAGILKSRRITSFQDSSNAILRVPDVTAEQQCHNNSTTSGEAWYSEK